MVRWRARINDACECGHKQTPVLIEYKRTEGGSTGRYYRIGKYGCFRAAICGNLKSVEAFSVKANSQLIRWAVCHEKSNIRPCS
jgi:hypothetical protein